MLSEVMPEDAPTSKKQIRFKIKQTYMCAVQYCIVITYTVLLVIVKNSSPPPTVGRQSVEVSCSSQLPYCLWDLEESLRE